MDLFLCGDVMTGRGIDQILPHPSDPTIYEPFTSSAIAYVELAERVSGPIPRPVDFAYIWGDALDELQARRPDVRLVNLETSVTTSASPEPKGINYRMHPANVPCLSVAGIDCCVVANNHVLDWGRTGLIETVRTLSAAGIATAGAGATLTEASRPAVVHAKQGGRVLVFAFGSTTSGIPASWAATDARPGINLLPDFSEQTVDRIGARVRALREPGDRIVVSIHWGANWGHEIPQALTYFAHRLIDGGVADVVHGHSSHHVKRIEVYGGRLVLYGCGDFLTDYEGISGHEAYRPDFAVAYFASLDDESGRLTRLEMVPFRSRRFRLERVASEEVETLRRILDQQCKAVGTRIDVSGDGVLRLRF